MKTLKNLILLTPIITYLILALIFKNFDNFSVNLGNLWINIHPIILIILGYLILLLSVRYKAFRISSIFIIGIYLFSILLDNYTLLFNNVFLYLFTLILLTFLNFKKTWFFKVIVYISKKYVNEYSN